MTRGTKLYLAGVAVLVVALAAALATRNCGRPPSPPPSTTATPVATQATQLTPTPTPERPQPPTPSPSPAPTPSPTIGPLGSGGMLGAACQARGPLPDPGCTPGDTNPDVTQNSITVTICVRGWTATVRPSVSVTGPIKTERMQAYGFSGPQSGYELDHLIPLELGGATQSLANLWPEAASPTPGFHQKDQLENRLRELVCAGKLDLASAQHDIATDWLSAYQQYLGATP